MKYIFFTSLVYLVLISVVYFSKKKIKTLDNQIYTVILVLNIFGLSLDLIQLLLFELKFSTGILVLLNKLFLIYVLFWTTIFTIYIVNIGNNSKNKKIKHMNLFLLPISLSVLVFFTPLNYKIANNLPSTSGIPVFVTYLGVSALIIIMILIALNKIKNNRNINKIKFLPLMIFILFGTFATVIQMINPYFLLTSPVETLITILTFFTIENPDVKVIDELNKNKMILEKNNEDKSNFMFRMTQEVRKPANNIENLSNMIDTKNEYVKLEDVVSAIKSNTRHISYVVNNVLDVSNIDIRNIKIVESTYNIKILLNEIKILVSEQINNNIAFRCNISNEMPEKLYGDPVKLKQVIMSILNNSIKYTKKGFIELNVDVLIKYDMCRLIIGIEDSGVGMDIKKINDILTSDRDVNEEEINKIDTLDVDLILTKKIINIIGGSMMIKSEINKGTEFIVTVDQRVVTKNKKNNQEKIIYNLKKVLLVDDNINYLTDEKKILENVGIDVVSTMYGMDAIDRIRTGEKYDLILLDDDMEKLSGVATFDELNKIDRFDTKVIIMLDKNKEIIKKHYLEKGFIDYILKSDLENEIKRIVDKYLK